MDIISHSLTGVAVATVVATVSNNDWKQSTLLLFTGALGGALPDIDALSLWKKFDVLLGGLFNLNQSGRQIYAGKLWYSHHAFFHSLLAPILLILLFILFVLVIKKRFTQVFFLKILYKEKFIFLTFLLAYFFHLLEDMPTPSSVWGGVNLLFPSTTYFGGYGKIWWWNNYDIFLIICAVIVMNLLILLLKKSLYKLKSIISLSIFIIGFSLALFQINNRPISFNYTNHTSKYHFFETESKRIQKEILGEKIYKIMLEIDNSIPLHF